MAAFKITIEAVNIQITPCTEKTQISFWYIM